MPFPHDLLLQLGIPSGGSRDWRWKRRALSQTTSSRTIAETNAGESHSSDLAGNVWPHIVSLLAKLVECRASIVIRVEETESFVEREQGVDGFRGLAGGGRVGEHGRDGKVERVGRGVGCGHLRKERTGLLLGWSKNLRGTAAARESRLAVGSDRLLSLEAECG